MWRWLLARFRRPAPDCLPDPFRAEVLLDGAVVGRLTDRVWVEMFWASYRLEPLDPVVCDDQLWNRCRFTFRDPVTGRVCKDAFVGGTPPFLREGRIFLRAMDFVLDGERIEAHPG